MTGVIVINKEQKFTSFDVVAVMRGITKEKKIGHTGTLDPMATGVLPILLGRGTKACDLLPNSDKTYVADFKFGIKTDTGDIWGQIKEEKLSTVLKEDVEKALSNFRGDIFQIPPMYSAVSVNGQRLYDLARKGIEVEREKRAIHISKLELLDFDGENGKLEISCSKGTYIRTLIEDIAESLGYLATMTGLVRTYACGFSANEALTLKQLEEIVKNGKLEEVLKPVENLFEEYPIAQVTSAQATRFSNGGELDISRLKLVKIKLNDGDILRVYDEKFIGLGKINLEKNCLKFLKKFE
ncbi:MAG: tRNA pseudouridine(55) synthase TruB [Clostridia bacterium]